MATHEGREGRGSYPYFICKICYYYFFKQIKIISWEFSPCRELIFTRLNISSDDTTTFATIYRVLLQFSLARNVSRGGGGQGVGGPLPEALLPILLQQTAQAYGVWGNQRWVNFCTSKIRWTLGGPKVRQKISTNVLKLFIWMRFNKDRKYQIKIYLFDVSNQKF